MVAFTSLIVLLATAQALLAAPISHDGSHMHRRRACPAKSKTTSVQTTATSVTTTHQSTSTHHSTTSTSAKSTATAEVKTSSKTTNALHLIWPVSVAAAKSSWSTAVDVDDSVKLSDKALNILSGASTSHAYDTAPDGSSALRAHYPKGSIDPGSDNIGGFGMYALTGIDLSKGTEVLMSYKAYFQDGFQFNKGGKMPGLFLGTSNAVAKKCSGGEHGDGACASSRLMFRKDGAGELYAYFPQVDSNTKALQTVPPKTVENDTYGTSVGRGSFKWATGDWTAVTQRLKLNDIGSKNGEFQLWVNGESVMNISGLQFRTSAESRVRGIQLQTFFGGHDSSWGSPKDQSCWFKDISAAVLA